MKYLTLLFVFFLLTACGSLSFNKDSDPKVVAKTDASTTAKIKKEKASGKPASVKNQSKSKPSHYTIQPGDVLEISVWKEKDLQKEVLVRADGNLTFPLVGDINAAGLSFGQFQKNLTAKLSRYVPRPVVTVSIKQPLGNKVFVIGKVNKPGEIINARSLDVMQALSIAGGLNPFASERRIQILRRENGKLIAIPFNYNKVKKGKKLEQNIILRSGDVVVVR